MKTRAGLIIALALALLCFGVCAEQEPESRPAKVYRAAWLTPMPCEQESLYSAFMGTGADWEEKSAIEETYYDSLITMLMDMQAGRLDYINIPKSVAVYLQRSLPELNFVDWGDDEKIKIRYMMATLPENEALCAQLDAAIGQLEADGTIARLVNDWVTDLPAGEPVSEPLETLADARAIRIGVTGDIPPLDFVATDGAPAGFNVELLRAIGRLLGVNFEIIQIDTNARLVALQTGRVDAIYWVAGYTAEELDNTSIQTTQAYYQDSNVNASIVYDMEQVMNDILVNVYGDD